MALATHDGRRRRATETETERDPLHTIACRLDAAVLAEHAGIVPDDWQAAVLRSLAPRLLLNCSRQSGKSTISAVLALHAALYEPGSLVLLLSPTLRQSSELFRKCAGVYRALGRPVRAESESALQLALDNGSRIVSLPGKEGTVRGFSGVRLLVIDEAAWVPGDLYLAVRPMLAVSGGRLVALSTPHGARGWFFEAWRGQDTWDRYEVPATSCPRISADFLDEERRTMGDWWFQQEYGCQFLASETQPFGREDVEAAFREDITQWNL